MTRSSAATAAVRQPPRRWRGPAPPACLLGSPRRRTGTGVASGWPWSAGEWPTGRGEIKARATAAGSVRSTVGSTGGGSASQRRRIERVAVGVQHAQQAGLVLAPRTTRPVRMSSTQQEGGRGDDEYSGTGHSREADVDAGPRNGLRWRRGRRTRSRPRVLLSVRDARIHTGPARSRTRPAATRRGRGTSARCASRRRAARAARRTCSVLVAKQVARPTPCGWSLLGFQACRVPDSRPSGSTRGPPLPAVEGHDTSASPCRVAPVMQRPPVGSVGAARRGCGSRRGGRAAAGGVVGAVAPGRLGRARSSAGWTGGRGSR